VNNLGWLRTDAYFKAKVTFPHHFLVRDWGAYYTCAYYIGIFMTELLLF